MNLKHHGTGGYLSMELYKIRIAETTNQKDLENVINSIDRLKSKPAGVYELIWQFFHKGEAISYKNERVLWLGWQLEKRGIKVKWYSC